jgi:hypothetical protein
MTTDNKLPFGLRRKLPLYMAARSGEILVATPEFPGSDRADMQPALPAGFIFQTLVASAKIRFEARTIASSSFGPMVQPLSRARWCAIFPALPKLRAQSIRLSSGRRRRLLRWSTGCARSSRRPLRARLLPCCFPFARMRDCALLRAAWGDDGAACTQRPGNAVAALRQ